MNTAKVQSMRSPSLREMESGYGITLPSEGESSLSKAVIATKRLESTTKGTSYFMLRRSMTIGATIAVMPTMPRILKIFDPTTFPRAISAFPLMAETTLTTNSGAELPTATMVSPTTMVGIPKWWAIDAAPSVSQSAPLTIAIRPIANSNTKSNSCIRIA